MSVDVQLLNPFLGAACEVLQQVVDECPTKGQIAIQNAPVTTQQVNVILRASGQLDGVVVVGMSFITADRLASVMLDQAIKSFDQAAANAVAELVTRLSTHAKLLLHESGLRCELSSPAVIKGSRVEVSGLSLPAIIVPIDTSIGEIQLIIGLRKLAHTQAA